MIDALPASRRLTIAALVGGLALVILGAFGTVPFSVRAQDYTEDIATNATITYAALRGINAAISFVQEVEVGASVVVSGSINPFMFLEPVDDAVERLSSAIFVIAAAAAILSILLATIGNLSFIIVGLSLMGVSALRLSGIPPPRTVWLARFLDRVFHLGLTGILIVAAFAVASLVADNFSETQFAEYNEVLSEVGASGEALDTRGDPLSLPIESIEAARNFVDTVVNDSDKLIRAINGLLAAFIFKTLILPLLLAFVFIYLTRHRPA